MSAAKPARVKCPECRRHRSVFRASRDGTQYHCFRCKLTFLPKAADAERQRYDTVRMPPASAAAPAPALTVTMPIRVVMDVPVPADESPAAPPPRDEARPSADPGAARPVIVAAAPAAAVAVAPAPAADRRPSIDLAAAVPVLETAALLAAHATLMTLWFPQLAAWARPLTAVSLLLATAGLAAAHGSRPRRAVRSAAAYLGACILVTLPAVLLRPAAAPAGRREGGSSTSTAPAPSHTRAPERAPRPDGAGLPPHGPR
jgi:hypothetical protein